jgi:hypothetical protein
MLATRSPSLHFPEIEIRNTQMPSGPAATRDVYLPGTIIINPASYNKKVFSSPEHRMPYEYRYLNQSDFMRQYAQKQWLFRSEIIWSSMPVTRIVPKVFNN